MTTLLVQPTGRPTSARDGRALEAVRDHAADELAGRTVWSASALPGASAFGQALTQCLRWAGGRGVQARTLDVAAGEPLRALAERLEQMLQGAGSETGLGPAEDETYASAVRDGAGPEVAPGDIVVLHDALVATLAEDVRERGAHAVWALPAPAGQWPAATVQAWSFLRRHTPAVDALVMTWFQPGERGLLVERVAALMPSADLVSAKEIAPAPPAPATPPFEDVAWSSLLADVVHSDRGEHVGGRRHARPGVPAR